METNYNKRACPVCGKYDAEKLEEVKMKLSGTYHLPEAYDIVACKSCGMVYASTEATMEDYDEYYTNFNMYCEEFGQLIREQSRYLMFEDAFENNIKKEDKILDIGCGNGSFLLELKQKGYNHLMGIDPSGENASRLKKNEICVSVGNVYDTPTKEMQNQFDIVFLFDVMEHLLCPELAINQIKKYLKEKGMFFLGFPDYAKIAENNTPIPNNFNQEHINYFSKTSLENLMKLTGFSLVYSKRIEIKNGQFVEWELIQGYVINEINSNTDILFDEITAHEVKKYFKAQENKESERKRLIEQLKNSREKLIIWGTGAFTMNLIADTAIKECNITGYVDNNPQKIGMLLNGKKINAPTAIKSDETILVCSMLHYDSILEQIKEMNLKNKVIVIK